MHGLPVLIQYAYDDGEVILHNIWREEIRDTLALIEDFCSHPGGICGFNLAFDWFHVCKTYTTFRLLDPDILPLHQVDEVALKEKEARSGPCLKPQKACDLMLHARKGPYQSTMNRNSITIKRIPTTLAQQLADHLKEAIPLKDIYFARKKDPKQRWQLQDIVNDLDDVDPYFKNVVLRFSPSSALKALAVDALGVKEDKVLKFIDISPPSFKRVTELGYAPFALAVGEPGKWNKAWPFWVWEDVFFWEGNKNARKYAKDDVIYTRDLYYHFNSPPCDVDSTLACMVSSVRWHGYAVDLPAIEGLKVGAKKVIDSLEFNVNSAAVCKKYLKQVMTDLEYGVMTFDGKTSTKKVILEEIAKWSMDDICEECEGDGCDKCPPPSNNPHPAAIRAQAILDARSAHKEIELYDKLLLAGRFHASFKVIGALSSRMSGADGLNAQGIKHANYVRQCFTLKDEGMVLCGGDFDAFEISIMDAVYGDPKMHEELTGPYKIHGLWGQRYFFPHMSYDEILQSKEDARTPWEDKYSRSKQGVFAVCYFGEGFTLVSRVGIPEAVADEAYQSILRDYSTFAAKRQDVTDMFCSMKQEGGIGSKISWAEPHDYVESLLGFKRFFTLENQICKVLYTLAESPPQQWQINQKVTRRDRVQTACGALRSALFAAAFAVQSSNMRAAGNHRIQSTGAELTKQLQAELWEIQPAGICSWQAQIMNVHDELMMVTRAEHCARAKEIVDKFIVDSSAIIPLVGMSWQEDIDDWSGKGGSHDGDENDDERDEALCEAVG
ncbi:MAG: hypothetical protein D4S01_00720 [Dehalococcoidia bacterium]|nr:MAG: hypothetical protein D4S01_00720 [Dehalococcoidia bacterium]